MGWLSGWSYRKSHEIEGSNAGAQTNYQVKIIVHYESGTDYNDNTKTPPEGHIYVGGKSRVDFQDIRFTRSDGVTELDYWFENEETAEADGYGIFWVEVDSISASPDTTTIYIYYGKSDATTTSNGDNTFIIFDDWEDGQDHVDTKWTVVYTRPTTLGGSHSVITDGNVKVLRFYLGTDNTSRAFKSLDTVPDGFALRYRTKMLQGATTNVFTLDSFPRFQNIDNFERTWYHNYYEEYRINKRVSASTTLLDHTGTDSYPWSDEYNAYRVYEVRVSGVTFKFLREDTEILSSTNGWDTTDKPIAFGAARWSDGTTCEVYYDWVLVRKWVNPEPTHGSWGSEEQSGGATEITITDSISLSDSVLRHKTVSINDSIGVSDSILGHKTFTITDLIQTAEQILRDKSFAISDSISLSDLVNVITQILKTVTDSIGLSDQVLTHKTFAVSDQITLSDQALRHKLVEISDQISLLESTVASKLFIIIDQIGLTDTVQIIQIIKVIKDSVSLLDKILTHKQLTVQDQVTLTEAIRLLGVLAKLIKILTESFIPIKIETGNLSYFDPSSFDKDDFIADEPFIPLKITSEPFNPIKIECEEVIE